MQSLSGERVETLSIKKPIGTPYMVLHYDMMYLHANVDSQQPVREEFHV